MQPTARPVFQIISIDNKLKSLNKYFTLRFDRIYLAVSFARSALKELFIDSEGYSFS